MSLEREIPRKRPTRIPDPKRVPKDPLESLFREKLEMEILEATMGFRGGSHRARKPYQVILWSWTASLIDSLLVISLSCFFLLAFSSLMKTPLARTIMQMEMGTGHLLSVVGGLSVAIYMIVLRSFLGFSFGEWACGLKMGSDQEQAATFYSFRVVFRTLLILATGLIVLPVLSLLFRKDLPGKLTGVHLTSIK